jgi:hypothetical protein
MVSRRCLRILDIRGRKLRAWSVAIARRGGAKRVHVAAARKLAVIMYRIRVFRSVFETGMEKTKPIAA